jgi:hypothetical protein
MFNPIKNYIMNLKRFLKKCVTLILMLILFANLNAQDNITFTWQGSHNSGLYGYLAIQATNDEEFSINWGDGSPSEIKNGIGTTTINLYHEYEYIIPTPIEYTVAIAASNVDCRFTYFDCHTYITDDVPSFQLTSLSLSDCSELEYLYCDYNSLQLSDLYAAHLVINNSNGKLFGTQFLPYQPLIEGVTVDFSEQTQFGGIETVFTMWKNGKQAILNLDYHIDNGIITFINDGIYSVDMTNTAIVSHPDYPAVVIAGVDLTSVNISENSLPNLKIYPNPTNDVVYIKTEYETVPEVKLYSFDGKLLQHVRNSEIDLSKYSMGIYFLSVNGRMVKIVKK